MVQISAITGTDSQMDTDDTACDRYAAAADGDDARYLAAGRLGDMAQGLFILTA